MDTERCLKSRMAPCRSGAEWSLPPERSSAVLEDGAEALHRHAASWSLKPGTCLNSAVCGENGVRGSLLTRDRHMVRLPWSSASSPVLSEAAFPCAFSCIFHLRLALCAVALASSATGATTPLSCSWKQFCLSRNLQVVPTRNSTCLNPPFHNHGSLFCTQNPLDALRSRIRI